ncbi:dethiobiotin synthase [bacterium]|nr:dethiobiotin synthase [bacterium]
MKSLFVMGADTSVGKTVVSAGLLKAGVGHGEVAFWKPIQTGTIVGSDTEEVRSLTGLENEAIFLESVYRFADPMTAVLAAEKWGKILDVDTIVQEFKKYQSAGKTLVIEGTGGLLAPLNEKHCQADLIERLNCPVIVVGEDRTGIVNQVLMTLRCAKDWKLNIVGVVLMNSRGNLGNGPAIDRFGGGVKVILEVPPMPDKRSLVAHLAGASELRKLLGVSVIPT